VTDVPSHCVTTQIAKHLVQEGAQIEAKDEWGCRALHQAALYGHDHVVTWLLEKGAEVGSGLVPARLGP
jgi:ankyrin repeat protein